MKFLLLIVLVSCGQYQVQPLAENLNSDIEVDVSEYKTQFVGDAQSLGVEISLSDIMSVKITPSFIEDEVSCQEDYVQINKSKWELLNNALSDKERIFDHVLFEKSKKSLVYKALALCFLKQNRRMGFNHFPNIVPVPDSLTYKYSVASSYLVNYCYNDNGIGIYPTEDECLNYYQESLWDAYVYELFYEDSTHVLDQAEILNNR